MLFQSVLAGPDGAACLGEETIPGRVALSDTSDYEALFRLERLPRQGRLFWRRVLRRGQFIDPLSN